MTHDDPGLLIIGAAYAGSELAIAARPAGWTGPITLLGDEASLPYQRPPLSKAYLTGELAADGLVLRAQAVFDKANVTLRLGARLAGIDRDAHTVTLADGAVLPYRKLALCTGGRPRPLVCDGIDPADPPVNLRMLRTRADADVLRERLVPGTRLVVIGAGYVGLEVAASARKLGAEVTVLEAAPRVLARVASEALSAFVAQAHTAAGVDIRTGVTVSGVTVEAGRIVQVLTGDGARFDADLVLAGIGMIPNCEAAREAGLADALGVVVDACGATADPDIVAAGDCTSQQLAPDGPRLRIESVPNALEQARAAAAWVNGTAKPNTTIPWFWSDQYDLKFQLVGLIQGADQVVVRGDPATRAFAVFHLREGRLHAVEAVSKPADFMLTRRALPKGAVVDAGRLADESVPLKELLG